MLADTRIRWAIEEGWLSFDPPLKDVQIQPASVDLTLGPTFVEFTQPLVGPNGIEAIDPTLQVPPGWTVTYGVLAGDGYYTLKPGAFVLATTIEKVSIGPTIAARVEGKSSLGRLGLVVHATAGFIDPGFTGNITLELTNFNPRPIILRLGMKICQLSFYKMEGRVARPYGHPDLNSKYQGQIGTTTSRSWQR